MENLTLIKVSKVTSNDKVLMVYLPKRAVEMLRWKKGVYVAMWVDRNNNRLILELVQA